MIRRRKKRYNFEIFQIKNNESDSIDEKESGIIYAKNNLQNLINNNEFTDENFANNSLWLFSSQNKFRISIQKLVSSKSFILIINTLIFLNCIFLILETIEYFQIISVYSKYVFTVLFIIEFILKVIAYGFVLEPYSYLRDAWNWLDFIVVISSLINLFPQINANLFALTTFRLLRPLKTMSILPHMRTFITVLINSLIDVGIVFLLLLFFIIIFAIFGLSLWNENFEYRCRTSKEPINGKLEIDSKYFYNLCGGEIKCDNCLSVMNFYREKHFFLSEIYEYENELNYEQFNYGLTTFNNIGLSILTVFQVLTGEGWNNIMFLLMDGYNYYASIIYFVLCIVINYYFMINLIVAVLIYNFRKARKNDVILYYDDLNGNVGKTIKKYSIMMNINLDNYNERKMKKMYQLKYSPIELSKNFIQNFHNFNEYDENNNNNDIIENKNNLLENYNSIKISFWKQLWRKIHCFSKIKEHSQYHKKHKFAFYCYILCKQPIFQIFIYICIILNGVIVALDRINISNTERELYEKINIILVSIFCLEMFITIVGYGKDYFYDWIYIFDGVIVFVSLIEVLLNQFDAFGEHKNNSTSITSTFQLLRIFRIFKLLRSWESFQIIMESIWETMIRIIDFLILFIIFIFMYTLLGFQFFNNSLRFVDGKFHANSESTFYNFDNFPNSLVCVFMVIIGDHWYEIFYDCYRSDKNNPALVIIYFVTLIVFGNITLLNIFLAYLIENFQSSLHHLEKNRNVHYFILGLIYKSSEISASKIINYQEIINKKGDKLLEKIIKKPTNQKRYSSVYNYYLMKLYSKNLEFEGELELIAKNRIDFILFEIGDSEYYKKTILETSLDMEKSYIVKKTFTLHKIIDDDPKKEEKARNDAIKYIDTHDSYYEFKINYEMENDAKTNEKVNEMMYYFVKYYIMKNSQTEPSKNLENIINSETNMCINNSDSESLTIINESSFYSNNEKKDNESDEIKTDYKPFQMRKSFVPKKSKLYYDEFEKFDDRENEIQLSKTLKRPSISKIEKNILIEKKHNNVNIHKKYTYQLPKPTNLISQRTKFIIKSEALETISDSESEKNNIIMDNSLFIFSPNNKLRLLCITILNHWLFNYILITLILGNLVIICLNHPWLDPSSKRKQIINSFNYIFNIIFIIEAFIIIISKGFLFNKNAYLRSVINIIDFICIIIGIIDMIWSKNIGYLRTFRAIRTVKIIRIITHSENLYMMTKTLVASVSSMANLIIICIIFIIILALIGVSIFKTSLYQYCLSNPKFSRDECIKNNGIWIDNEDNFANFFEALKVIFEIMVAENWSKIMMISSLTKHTKNYIFFYVFVVILLHMLFLNLIIAIIIQKYHKIKKRRNYNKELTEPEREWVHIQKIFMKYHPIPKLRIPNQETFRKKISKIVTSKKFDLIISILIILSCCNLVIQHKGSSKFYDNTLTIINLCFSLLFTIELIMKLIVYRKLYFMNNWNIFDFVIIILGDLLAILNILSFTNLLNVKSLSALPIIVLRLLRIFRILRLINNLGKLRSLIDTLLYLIPSILGIGFLILILITIYGNIGMHAFSQIPYRKYISRNNNFRDFISSITLLFQCISGEDWVFFMSELAYHDCREPTSEKYNQDYYCFTYNVRCYNNNLINYDTMTEKGYFSCGSNFSYIYFISFMIIGPIFMMNLCVVMVIEGFNESIYENRGYMPLDLMEKFINLWMDYDPLCTKVVKPYEFILIMKQLPPPIGFNYDRYIIQGINDIVKTYKRERDYKQFLNCKKLIYTNRNKLYLDKPNYSLSQSYEFNNIYLSNDGKFYTSDIEVMKLISKFQILVNEEKLEPFINSNNHILSQQKDRNSFIFSANKLKKEFSIDSNSNDNMIENKEKFLFVHFLDVCMIISQFAISKSMNVHFDSLRRNIVSFYTKKFWKREYKNENIEHFFNIQKRNSGDDNKLSILLACQVLLKFKRIIKQRIKKAKEELKIKSLPKELFGNFSEMRKFKKDYLKVKRVNSEYNFNDNNNNNLINNMNQMYINMTHINLNNGIYDTNIYAPIITNNINNNFIDEHKFSGIFYNSDELKEIKNNRRNNSFSHSGNI